MQRDLDPPQESYRASVQLNVVFHHTVTTAKNREAAHEIVRRQAEIFTNKAREEALRCGCTAEITLQAVI